MSAELDSVWDVRGVSELAWQRYQTWRTPLFRIEIASRLLPWGVLIAGAVLAQVSGALAASEWGVVGIGVAVYALSNAVLAGHYRALVIAARGDEPRLVHLFGAWREIPKMLVLFVLTYLAIAIGFLAAIVPGLVLQQRLRFAPYLAIEGIGPIAALRKSFAMTRGQGWRLFKQDFWDELQAQASTDVWSPAAKVDIAVATALAEAILYLGFSEGAPASVRRALSPEVEPPRAAPRGREGPACPRCAEPLEVVTVPDLELCRCRRCGGVWLDNAGSRAVAEELAHNAVAAADAAATLGKAPVDRAAPARCPICEKELARVAPVPGLAIDVCDQHGTWFDREELRIVSRALHPVIEEAQGSVHLRGAKNIAVSFARNVVAMLSEQ